MAKVVQTQLLDEDVFGIEQSENHITAKQGNIVTGNENDKITLTNTITNGNPLTLTLNTGDGNDIININHEIYTSQINLGNGNDTINIKNRNYLSDPIELGEGDDKITVSEGYIIVNSGAGDDTISSKGEKVTLVVNVAETTGDDVIEQGKGTLILDFTGIEEENVKFEASGNDLLIKVNNSTLTVKNHLKLGSKSILKGFYCDGWSINEQYDEEYYGAIPFQHLLSKIEGYKLLDNKITGTNWHDSIITGSGNDIIKAGKGDDIIISGSGNDTISAGTGVNTIVINEEAGTDIINSDKGYDALKFEHCSYEDLGFYQEGNDLIIHHSDMGLVNVKNYFKLKGKHSVQEIMFSENEPYNLSEILVEQGLLNDSIYIEKELKTDKIFDDIYNYVYDDENYVDEYSNEYYGDDTDEIIIGSKGTNYIATGLGDDIVKTYSKHDYIWCEGGNNKIDTGAGDDHIQCMSGENEINSGAGNDDIYCGMDEIEGHYNISAGAGNDYISIMSGSANINAGTGNNCIQTGFDNSQTITIESGKGTDTLMMHSDITSVEQSEDGYDLILNENIILKDYYKLNGKHSVKYINYCPEEKSHIYELKDILNLPMYQRIDGDPNKKNNLKGSSYEDSIMGGKLNDTIKGGSGNDTIYGSYGNDKLYGDGGNDSMFGGEGDDTIYGGAGINEITAGGGKDTIYCDKNGSTHVTTGEGENKIYSSAGANTFCIGNFNSTTYIYNATANDTLDLTNLEFSSLGEMYLGIPYKSNDIHIWFENNGARIVLKNYLKAKDANFLTNIVYGDGIKTTVDEIYKAKEELSHYEYQEYEKVNFVGSFLSDYVETGDYADTIKGGYGNDTIISSDGKDKIYGGYGDDSIVSGNFNKYIDGGNGDDYISAGIGNHKIYGRTGNDDIYVDDGKSTIYGGDGGDGIFASGSYQNCKLYGEKGNDTIFSGYGNDYIDGGDGNDTIYAINDGNGKDTIYGGKGSDTYYLSTSDFRGSLIYDKAGYDDKIILENFSNNSNIIYFDLKIDKKGNIVESSSKNLYISNTDFMQYHKDGDAYHKVKDFFVKGHAIENIESSDGSYIATYENICFVREQVAQWLYNETSYKSIDAVIKAGGDDLLALQEILADCWQNVEQNY